MQFYKWFSITKDDFIKGLYNNSGLTEDLFFI